MNEDRQKIWDNYRGITNGSLERMFLYYNRYYEAGLIFDALKRNDTSMKNFKVLDYGCGVADYGIYFARLGADVTVHDIDHAAVMFAESRFALENLEVKRGISRDKDYNLVIFGEVLDHLFSPLQALEEMVDSRISFIFTSSYPYRSDDKNDVHWQHDHHPETARMQQSDCRILLKRNYAREILTGEGSLWVRR